MFNCVDLQHTSITSNKGSSVNNLIYGLIFCIIIYKSYKVLKWSDSLAHLIYKASYIE